MAGAGWSLFVSSWKLNFEYDWKKLIISHFWHFPFHFLLFLPETDIDSGVDENTQQGDGSPKTGSGTDHTQNWNTYYVRHLMGLL